MGARKKDKGNFIEKLKMYDYIVANLVKGSDIIEPREELGSDRISIGFDSVSSSTYITKYMLVTHFPDWLDPRFMDIMRADCLASGVKINYYIYSEPHTIHWESDEMINKMNVWKRYSADADEDINVFEYRDKRDDILNKQRIINSWKYLNVSELEHKRTLCKVAILIEVSGKRDKDSILYMKSAIVKIKQHCAYAGIELTELKINLGDWLRHLGIFSLRSIKELNRRVPKQVVTDDLLANMNSYKQGKIGSHGIPIGMDIFSRLMVLKDFKANKSDAENWLVCAASGAGKSLFVKDKLYWFVGVDITTMVIDFEGDEYSSMAAFIKAGCSEDVAVVSMGKGSACYYDPLEIPKLTGDPDVDNDLKDSAIKYTLRVFRTILKSGTNEELNKFERGILSTLIREVYENHNVTEDKSTWINSKGIRIREIFEALEYAVDRKIYADDTSNNIKHITALEMLESCIPYFVEGESQANTFKNPIILEDLYKAKFIVFSFGEKGTTASEIDPVTIQLKQLSVSNITSQISNYCHYVKKTLSAIVWEEYQRWKLIPGSSEIITNSITGGRKRGVINIVNTNDLASMLDEEDRASSTLFQNFTSYAIGAVKDANVREKFCNRLGLSDLLTPLETIYNHSGLEESDDAKKSKGAKSKYNKAFCVVMDGNEKAIVKVEVPKVFLDTELFSTDRIKDKKSE